MFASSTSKTLGNFSVTSSTDLKSTKISGGASKRPSLQYQQSSKTKALLKKKQKKKGASTQERAGDIKNLDQIGPAGLIDKEIKKTVGRILVAGIFSKKEADEMELNLSKIGGKDKSRRKSIFAKKGSTADKTEEASFNPEAFLTVIDLPDNLVGVSCSNNLLCVLTETGEAYITGSNSVHSTCLGREGDQRGARYITNSDNVLASQVVSWSKVAKCFYNQKFDNLNFSNLEFEKMSLPQQAMVKQISCGNYHGSAVSNDSKLIIWGVNHDPELLNTLTGQLGITLPHTPPNLCPKLSHQSHPSCHRKLSYCCPRRGRCLHLWCQRRCKVTLFPSFFFSSFRFHENFLKTWKRRRRSKTWQNRSYCESCCCCCRKTSQCCFGRRQDCLDFWMQ